MHFLKRFNKRLDFSPQITRELYNLITKIDTVKGQWKLSNKLSPQMIMRLQSSVLITSAGASTRIEGSKLSDDDVEELFRKMRIKKIKTRDEQEVAGYLELLQKIFKSYEHINFSENMILGLHKQLLKYSKKDSNHLGEYKKRPNRVEARDHNGKLVGIIFDPTSPHLVEKEMSELINWTKQELMNDNYHPLLVISNFLFEFLAIHPFDDGNGRLSRVLTNFLLLKEGYAFIPYISHEKIIEENKADYYIALNKTQKSWKAKKENISLWCTFFLKTIQKQSELALKILSKESFEVFLSEKQTAVWQYALTHDVFQRSDVIKATGIKPRTVEESIKKLVRMKKLEKLGQGKATRYRIIKIDQQ